MEVRYKEVMMRISRGVPIEYFKTIISVIFNKNFNNLKPYYDKLKKDVNYN